VDFQYTRRYVEVRFCIQVLSNAVLLEGVPIRVTRVSNKVIPLVFHVCILSQPQFYLLNDRSLCYLKTLEYISSPKNSTKIQRRVGSRNNFDTTCSVP
jgi:hypothetical protein